MTADRKFAGGRFHATYEDSVYPIIPQQFEDELLRHAKDSGRGLKVLNSIDAAGSEAPSRTVRYGLWDDAGRAYVGRTTLRGTSEASFWRRQRARVAGACQYSDVVAVRNAVAWAKERHLREVHVNWAEIGVVDGR